MADEALQEQDSHDEDVEAHLLGEEPAPPEIETPRRTRIEIEPMDF